MRHGTTDWNAEKRIQGSTDIELNDAGRELAARAGEGMSDIPIDVCFTSPLKRAAETARIVLSKNRSFISTGAPVYTDPRITEISFGVWEGLKCGDEETDDIRSDDFRDFFGSMDNPDRPARSESIRQVTERTGAFLDDITHREELKDKNILIVVHGGTIRSMLYNITGDSDFNNVRIARNCEAVIIETDADGRLQIVEQHAAFF